jgi:hypothetical protein
MRSITAPERPSEPRHKPRGRWVWGLSGLATIVVLAIPGTRLITTARAPVGSPMQQTSVPTRTFTVTQPVSSVNVESYGAPIVVTGGSVRHVEVTEAITFNPQDAGPPAVTDSVSHGRLTLNAPECGGSFACGVGFTLTVPKDVAVTAQSDNGPLTVSGVAAANLDSGGGPAQVSDVPGQLTVSTENGELIASRIGAANLDSGGGPVRATDVRGPLTVNTENGNLTVDGLTGPLDADTGGGQLVARNVSAVTATVSTENGDADITFITAPELVSVDTGGGNARIQFAAAPQSVSVSTENGYALLIVPGGPYALTAQTMGGPLSVAIPTDPTASRSVSVNTGGGELRIQSTTGRATGFTKPGGKLPSHPAKPVNPPAPSKGA